MARTRFLCPHCNTAALIDEDCYEFGSFYLKLINNCLQKEIKYQHVICPNPKCKKSTLSIDIVDTDGYHGQVIFSQRILPTFASKPVPSCIPPQIAQDYEEACKICELSPKAAATLIRRCLQGMIRDYWQVSKTNLKDAIDDIQDKIDGDTWNAIESIRKIGNIGAHMEKDINLIIDVDANETQLLIELVESLFDEWYVKREKQRERQRKITEIAQHKEDQRHQKLPATPATAGSPSH